MPAIAWKDEYSVGDPFIDSQHQQLISTMNQLSALLEAATPPLGEAAKVFAALAVYVMDHFSYEEQRMAAAGMPAAELSAHQATHAGFVREIRGYQQRVAGGDLAALHELLPFLEGTWLTHHICETDRRYMPYLNGKATG